ncbi:hypothetical protein Q4Q35_18455 [Flavivirga aquimarina]|uniref:Heparinase n=1 Tax=Flavivirga aquimarina TaxID=2027862 RepID=A0ABT8WF52_9FLAO|nr:hypothetical protein [Flavivirga aquimarina]MDO5971788.1 hypothetical protein [Flavivirga aquimarina]
MNIKGKIKALTCPIFLLCFALIFSCNKQNNKPIDLNIAEYLSYANSDTIYPSAKQIEMLKAVMPKQSFQLAPSITARDYWSKIAASESGKDYLKEALSELEKEPEVPITDSIYRLANKQGNRGIYKPRYYRTMERLEHFILAECIENKGRFLSQIAVYSNAILAMKSWLHPNHDDDENGVLEGRRVSIDLGARKFGSVLALAEVLLGDKLKQDLRDKITTHLQWRIIDSYLKSCEILDKNNKWIKSTSNWNSVCTSGSVFVSITISKKEEERLAAIGCALNSMKYYLSGFGSDGYCSEGLGYWGYGFGHYLQLAQTIYDYTDGRINLFDADNPEKLKNVGNFPEKFEIQNRRCSPFSDGVSSIRRGNSFAYALSAKHYGSIKPTGLRTEEAVEQLMVWNSPESFNYDKNTDREALELPDYSYFDDFGMVISRGKQNVPFSIAMKAGHNKENHNHSDVGTYTLVLNSDIMAGDIGAPSYTAGAFSPNNKARSSWGHPVPRIDNTLQSNGRAFSGEIIATAFSEETDKVVMDIKAAYEIPSLEKLIRIIENDKSGLGTITIKDSFSSTKPVTFGIAIMTLNTYEIIDSNTVIITSKNQKVKAEIKGNGASIKITDEVVPVKKLREGAPAYRIGVDFTEPIKNGTITVKYTPVFE